jgi:hypothetical protein
MPFDIVLDQAAPVSINLSHIVTMVWGVVT